MHTETTRHLACIMLGSNIEPEQNIPRAVELLRDQLTILKASSVWESASADCCYPDFLNLALLASTDLDAVQLKRIVLRPLEARMGRVRSEDKNASRTIDLDIILFDGMVLEMELWQQVHLAVPVGELFPDLPSEAGEPLREVAMCLARSTPIQLRNDISIPQPMQL